MPNKKIAVIDGNSWLHRAYHAVPPVMKLQDGTPTNAVHGFMNMFLCFYEKAQPDAVICAFDAGIPKFRLEAVQEYKAQRKPMDNELRVQFPIIEEILKSMDIPVVKVSGWEGDDVLGTIADKCEKLGFESLLITGDKDANQLASDLTKIVNMKKGVSDVILYGPNEVYEKYGVKVEQFIDFLALMGDSSDNIPGVPGIGPKSAATLLQKFESLEGIYENLDQLKGKQKENIENNKDSAYISRQAATISKEVPIDLDLENIYFPSFDKDTVNEVFLRYRLRAALSGVLKFIGESPAESADTSFSGSKTSAKPVVTDPSTLEPPTSDKPAPELVFENYLSDDTALEFMNNALKNKEKFSVAIAHKMDDAPAQATLFDVADDEKYQYPAHKNLMLAMSTDDGVGIVCADNAVETLVKCFKCGYEFVAENAKDLFEIVYSNDTSANPYVTDSELCAANLQDVSLAAYLLNSSKSEYTAVDAYTQVFGNMLPTLDADISEGLKKTDEAYIEKKNKNLRLCLARRAAICQKITPFITELLNKCELDKIYNDIERPLTKALVLLQRNGAKIDISALQDQGMHTAKLLDGLKSEILELAGEEFNIDSPKQLGHILFEVLELPAKKKTKTGYSTAADVLEDLSKIHPLPGKIIKYRELAKLKSTYIDALPKLADAQGLVHTSFHQKVTTTGRLSSSDPNLQNIPTRSELGNKIRECFIARDEDSVFMSADYSQIELRVLAHLSQDKGLIEAFNSGQDFHTYTAANVYGVDLDKVDSNMRRTAKAVNFGIVYGQQAFGLSQTLGISVGEAKTMIEKYFATFPGVRAYLDEVVEFATLNGYAKTMFGRRRYIPELNAGNKNFQAFGQRTAMNHPMQGTAADIIKIAMIDVLSAMRESNLNAKCMLQVHDELDFSVPVNEVETLTNLVKDKMENAVKLNVPLKVDIATGANWALAK